MGLEEERAMMSRSRKKFLLILNCIILGLGNCGGPLLCRLYFVKGGQRIWLSSWLQTAAWPLILLPHSFCYINRRRAAAKQGSSSSAALFTMNRRVLAGTTLIGLLFGLANYFYAYGMGRLPVSTSSLIIASQLVFTAVSALFFVKQRFTASSVNAVVLLTAGAVVLGVDSSGDRPEGESRKEYYMGFAMMLASAAVSGILLPLVELMYREAKQEISYGVVMEIQLLMCFVATAFCTVGILANRDFQVMGREAREYGLGEARYYVVLVWTSIFCQFFFLGAIGVVFCASSLLSGIIIAVLLPVTEVLAVIFFNEKFQAEKGIALGLSIWGFVSYFYGELKHHGGTSKPTLPETELPQTLTT